MEPSENPTHLAFDLGASNGRVILGRVRNDAITLEQIHRFETPLYRDAGNLFWDLETIWQEILTGFRRAMNNKPPPSSLSVDTWGVDYVSLDENGELVHDPYSYRDSRTDGVLENALEVMSAQDIFQKTGISCLEINTLIQLWTHQHQESEEYHSTERRFMLPDYFNHRFGGQSVSELSIASTTQMIDVHNRNWSTEIMEVFNLQPKTWPPIVDSGTSIGTVSLPEHSEANVEIVAGCSHDTAAAVAAVPARPASNWAYISCGTWSLLGTERDEPIVNRQAMDENFTNEQGLDNTIRFLKNISGLWVMEECKRNWEENGNSIKYEEMLDRAQRAEPIEGTVAINDKQFLEPGDMPERIKQYCRDHDMNIPSSRGQLVRLILESLAHIHRDVLRSLESITETSYDILHIVGGGSRNYLLCQWTANACDITVKAGPAEATALGNLLIQAKTIGTLPDNQSIRDMVRQSTEIETYTPR